MATASSAALALGAVALSLPAHAVSATVTLCAALQPALNLAVDGDVITKQTPGACTGPFTLPNAAITLQGGTGDPGFDGTGNTAPILSGTDVGATVIQNLIFRNGHSNLQGGAIMINGPLPNPRILNSQFYANSADSSGGAVYVQTNGGATISGNTFGSTAVGGGNTALLFGGAVWIFAGTDSTISNNKFIDNSAAGTQSDGGGLNLSSFSGSDKNITVSSNTFSGNTAKSNGGGLNFQGDHTLLTVSSNIFSQNHLVGRIGSTSKTDNPVHLGGGAFIENQVRGTTNGSTRQVGNRFDGNVIDAVVTGTSDIGGGGEWLSAGTTSSLDDTFVNNQVGDDTQGFAPVGGALGLRSINDELAGRGVLNAQNLVATNNSVGALGEGGGLYTGFFEGCTDTVLCSATINLFDSTVAGNSVGASGVGAGMAGDAGDIATIANSIVNLNTGAPNQVDGFGTLGVTYSDACQGAAAAAGGGNICKDPKLKNLGGNDVHLTLASPAIDTGNNASVPAGLNKDYEGDPRIQGVKVDMGADEFEPPVPPTLPAAGHPAG
jgi:hypothetical protein